MLNHKVTCPNCGHHFPMEQSIREEIQQEFRIKWMEAQKKKEEEYKQKENQLLQQLQQQTKEAQQKELFFLQQEQSIKTREQALELEIQKKILQERTQLLEQFKKEEAERTNLKETSYALKIRELEKQLDDQKKLAEEMKRRVEQGSMQLQGEVQELALEALLKANFPFDVIEEVGKGVRGADCIQHIQNNVGQICGKIIYESKRTKDFSKDWIEKLKADMRNLNADIAVIVTQTMPKEMDRFGQKEGIWICSFHEVKSLAFILRDCIIKIFTQTKAQQNKTDKMHLLYDYLTSSTFAEQWNAIREGFYAMKMSIQKERDAMEKLWKAREKQLEKVLLNAAHLKGSIEGIAGTEAIDLNLLDESSDSILSISSS